MANQEESPDGKPRKDADRPSPDVEKRPTLTLPKGEEKGAARSSDPKSQGSGGEDPEKVGLTSDSQPDLDGKTTAAGGTPDAKGGDSAPLGPPGAGPSERNGPGDPGAKRQ